MYVQPVPSQLPNVLQILEELQEIPNIRAFVFHVFADSFQFFRHLYLLCVVPNVYCYLLFT